MFELLAQSEGIPAIVLFIILALSILPLVITWMIFTKAGQPGWYCLVPIFNIYIMLQIAGKPGWWLLLLCIPVANIVVSILMAIGLAESFGKGAGFGIGLILLPIIFMPILAFSDARYQG